MVASGRVDAQLATLMAAVAALVHIRLAMNPSPSGGTFTLIRSDARPSVPARQSTPGLAAAVGVSLDLPPTGATRVKGKGRFPGDLPVRNLVGGSVGAADPMPVAERDDRAMHRLHKGLGNRHGASVPGCRADPAPCPVQMLGGAAHCQDEKVSRYQAADFPHGLAAPVAATLPRCNGE